MRRTSCLKITVGCLGLCAALWMPVAFAADKTQQAGSQAQQAMPVQVQSVVQSNRMLFATYPGRVQAFQRVEVYARVAGILQSKFYEDGQRVNAGQLLYKIDDRRYRAAVSQAKAQLQKEQANLNQMQREYERISGLSRGTAISEQDVDLALANLEQAKASRAAAEAAVENALIDLDYTEVKAEIEGITGIKQQDVGNWVGSDQQNAVLTTITQLDPVYVSFALPDSERKQQQRLAAAGKLKLQPIGEWQAEVLDDTDQVIARGKMDFVDSGIDAKTGSVEARAKFDNPQQRLMPGEFVRLRVSVGERLHVFEIPQKAVMQVGHQAFVYVVKDGKAVLVPIVLAAQQGENWLVESGLQEGDQVIVANLIKLRPNTPVQVMTNAAHAEPKP
ncbi:efflux RND transporter periplasmic adaptor subunit [Thiomicrorhabdus cannonii]|uniref:efflux RND transporter periplasmic adaptor subunit n=1 Tax=Thiomicrorhabdus cannonii TaxID=2748011 RepID=UPI0015B944BE|nr:efflux RND transporter periplasmic adaptor subunit [Thiomicrorhabdus cannonii]